MQLVLHAVVGFSIRLSSFLVSPALLISSLSLLAMPAPPFRTDL